VQHDQEHRAFQGERMLALACQRLDNVAAAGLLPQPLEHQRRTDTAHRHHIRRATAHCIKYDCLRRKSHAVQWRLRASRPSASQCGPDRPGLQIKI
jgi:hypothetical protein